jgi:hypothetical protein
MRTTRHHTRAVPSPNEAVDVRLRPVDFGAVLQQLPRLVSEQAVEQGAGLSHEVPHHLRQAGGPVDEVRGVVGRELQRHGDVVGGPLVDVQLGDQPQPLGLTATDHALKLDQASEFLFHASDSTRAKDRHHFTVE